MIPYHPHPSDRAFGERQVHMLRLVGDYGRLVGHRLVAEDQHRAAVAFAERERRITEAGLHHPGIGMVVSSLRVATGSVLIRVGKRLRGAPVPASAPAEVPLA
ncbi:MAG: hypothetical protein M3R02_13645 [Chloroflexota bacterium]|nr:hypothetical protein [Chloroflexota bacterium]